MAGMFLLNMEMKNQGGSTLRQSSRSSMLRYKSELLHFITTTVFAPFLLYGLQEEKQSVTVELFSQYEEDPVSEGSGGGRRVRYTHTHAHTHNINLNLIYYH